MLTLQLCGVQKLCELGMVETGSAMLTVEDYQQQFEVTLYLKHR